MATAEYGVHYTKEAEKEFLPSPKFKGIYWQGIPEEEMLVGMRLDVNGQGWVIEVIGFQGSEGVGHTQLHQEPTQQEDVFFLCGQGNMTICNGMECTRRPGEQNYWDHKLSGVLTAHEAERASFVLAVASDIQTKSEKLVLNVTKEDESMLVVEPVSTRQGYFHSTVLEGSSLYFVVKRSRATLDTHELVGFAGPYSGGS